MVFTILQAAPLETTAEDDVGKQLQEAVATIARRS
jgi:hypothetical protein